MATKPTNPSEPKAFTRLTTEPTTSIGINGIAAPNKIWSTTPKAISPKPTSVKDLIHPETLSNIYFSVRVYYNKGDRGERLFFPSKI